MPFRFVLTAPFFMNRQGDFTNPRQHDTDEPTEADIAAELRAVGLYYHTGGRS